MKKGQERRRISALARHEKQLKAYKASKKRLLNVHSQSRDGLWDDQMAQASRGVEVTEELIANTKKNLNQPQ